MTEDQRPLSPHELNTLVRALRPSFAIYEVAQIERMREQCVRAAPVSPDPALRARLQRHEEAIEAVRDLMEDLRAEKLYVYSDRIRNILRDLDQ